MHLKNYNHYDRLLLHQFLSQSRILNSHNLVHFAMISTSASYGQGISSNALMHLTSSGLSCTYNTMMKKLKEMNHNMNDVITQSLSKKKHFVIVLDNNQKGNCKKFQRNGSSNEFVKVTGRFFKECHMFNVENHVTKESVESHVAITYVNQAIPSVYLMPAFNNIAPLADNEATKANQICNYSDWVETHASIDFSGYRVKRYTELLNITNIVSTVLMRYLTNYSLKAKASRPWNYQPEQFKNEYRLSVTKALCQLKCKQHLKQYTDFQMNILNMINLYYNDESKILILEVSLRDEITTKGYGMAVVELLVTTGIMKCINYPDACSQWVLTENYSNKLIYLCMDGLSLERHRSFMKKLMNIPQSYEKNYHQSIAFQRAIGQIVEISGPLHVAFHMLQTIYTIFGTLL